MTKGQIRVAEAYARGKMLDNSSWHGLLPRGITPSDVDAIWTTESKEEANPMVFDNNGKMLFVEFSTKTSKWMELPKGQRVLYENICNNSTNQRAVVAKIEPKPDKAIDTLHDVKSFQIMSYVDGERRLSPVMPGCQGKDAVMDQTNFKKFKVRNVASSTKLEKTALEAR